MQNIKSLPSPDDPEQALAAVVALRLMADRLENDAISKALSLGWTWSQIAEALGVSKQAAHKRHAKSVRAKSASEKPGLMRGLRHV